MKEREDHWAGDEDARRSGGKVPAEEGVLSLSQGASLGPWATTISRHDDQARPQCLENSQPADPWDLRLVSSSTNWVPWAMTVHSPARSEHLTQEDKHGAL